MASLLPTFPRLVLTVFEPIALLAGFVNALYDTPGFIANQYPPASPLQMLPPTPNAQIVTLQLGNLYMLMALLGLFILNITTDPRVVKAYVLALAIADIGHVAPTMWVMGWDRVMDVQSWNLMAWGNIGITAFLFVTRIGYLMGLFGKDRAVRRGKTA